jgi:hypothetical protein
MTDIRRYRKDTYYSALLYSSTLPQPKIKTVCMHVLSLMLTPRSHITKARQKHAAYRPSPPARGGIKKKKSELMEIGAARTIKKSDTDESQRQEIPTQETVSTADSFFRRDKNDEKGKLKKVRKKKEKWERRREGNRHR